MLLLGIVVITVIIQLQPATQDKKVSAMKQFVKPNENSDKQLVFQGPQSGTEREMTTA